MAGSVILCLLLMTVVFTPYMAAGDEGKPGAMTLLQAAKDGDTETVKALIERGADCECKRRVRPYCTDMGDI